MEWLTDNWILVVVLGGMAAMHIFGHGGHGGHKTDKKAKPQVAHDKTPDTSADTRVPSDDA